MPEISRTALVPYSAEQMYSLVNDVQTYPEFLPWCKRSTILEIGDHWMEVELAIRKGPLEQSFITRNSVVPNKSIQMNLRSKNFDITKLQGEWQFKALDDNSCKIEFKLEIELGISSLAIFLKPLFNNIATTMVDAFYQRAKEVYGKE